MLHVSLSPARGMNFNMHFGTDLISSALPWVNLQFRLCSLLQWFLCDFSHSLMPLFAIGLSFSWCLQAVLLYSICFNKPSGFNRFPKCLPSHNLSFLAATSAYTLSVWLSPWVRDSYFSVEVLTCDKEWRTLWNQWDIIAFIYQHLLMTASCFLFQTICSLKTLAHQKLYSIASPGVRVLVMYYLLWKAHVQIPVEKVNFLVTFSAVIQSWVAKFKIILAAISSN